MQAVLDTTVKGMQVSLRSSIHSDIKALIPQFIADIHDVRDRVSHMENKMGVFSQSKHGGFGGQLLL